MWERKSRSDKLSKYFGWLKSEILSYWNSSYFTWSESSIIYFYFLMAAPFNFYEFNLVGKDFLETGYF